MSDRPPPYAPPPSSYPPPPPPQHAPQPQQAETTPHAPSFVSPAAKSRLMILAGVFAGVILVGQFVLPDLVRGWLMPYGLLGGVELTAHQINNSAVWDGKVWYAENAASLDEHVKTRLMCLPLSGEARATRAAVLPVAEPWMVAGEDRLWIVAEETTACYRDGQLQVYRPKEWLKNVSRPFLYRGKPAIIAQKWPDYCLKVFEDGQWREEDTFKLGFAAGTKVSEEDLQAFESDGKLHLFCWMRDGLFEGTVYYRPYVPGKDEDGAGKWERAVRRGAGGQWKPARLGDQLAVFYHGSVSGQSGPFVIGVKRSDDGWEEFFTYSVGWDIGLGICPTGQGEDFILLRRILPMGTELIGIKDGQPAWRYEQEGDVGMLDKYAYLPHIPRLVSPALSVILAMILTLLMWKHKHARMTIGQTEVRLASIARRAAAVSIDTLLVATPFLVFAFMEVQELRSQELSLATLFGAIGLLFKLVCFGALWFALMLFLASVMEGRWGFTPGKWLFGIRVVRTDLRRCGLGWALLRNLLRIVDGLGWYIVGMLMVAFTAKWQRLGDLAAKSIVIRRPRA